MALTYCERCDSWTCRHTSPITSSPGRPRDFSPQPRRKRAHTSPYEIRRGKREGRLREAILEMLKAGHSLQQIEGRVSGAQSPAHLFYEEFGGHEPAPRDPHRRIRSAITTSLRDGYSLEWVAERLAGGQMPAELLTGKKDKKNAQAPQ